MKLRHAVVAVLGGLAAVPLMAGLLELLQGGSFVHLPIYAEGGVGGVGGGVGGGGAGIRLSANAETTGRMASLTRYDVRIDQRGLRAPSADAPQWLVAGDSLAFGLGVDGDEAVAALLTAAGLPAANAGVPAFTLPDSLRHAPPLVERTGACGVLLVVNPADDLLPVSETIDQRFVVAGRWLLHAGASPLARRFFASGWSHLQLPHQLAVMAGMARGRGGELRPRWVSEDDGGAALARELAAEISAFGETHPDLDLRVTWIPLDATATPGRDHPSAFGRLAEMDRSDGVSWENAVARDALAEALAPLPFVDLSEELAGRPELFLPGDNHLSTAGHAAVAAQLRTTLPDCR